MVPVIHELNIWYDRQKKYEKKQITNCKYIQKVRTTNNSNKLILRWTNEERRLYSPDIC